LHNLVNPQIGRIGVQTINISGHNNLLGENGKQEFDIIKGSERASGSNIVNAT